MQSHTITTASQSEHTTRYAYAVSVLTTDSTVRGCALCCVYYSDARSPDREPQAQPSARPLQERRRDHRSDTRCPPYLPQAYAARQPGAGEAACWDAAAPGG